MKKNILITILSLICVINTNAQISMVKYNDSISSGVLCALPKTSFIVEVHYSENITKPGIYADYAESMLGIEDVVKKEKRYYSIDDIILKPFIEADENARFYIKNESTAKSESECHVHIDENGILIGLGTISDNDITDKADDEQLAFSSKNATVPFNNYSVVPSLISLTDTISDNTDTAYEIITSTEEMSTEEKAEAALNSMMEIRQQRLDLLSGYQETNYSVEAFRYLASSLKQTEDSYLSMFIGSTSKNEHVHSFIFSPTADNVNKETSVLCFSEETGICSSTRNSNSQISISVIPRNQSVKKEPKLKENGIKYRIPVTAEIYARYKNKTYCGGIYQLPQLGKMMTFDMAKNKYVLYDSHTGSIRSIKVE